MSSVGSAILFAASLEGWTSTRVLGLLLWAGLAALTIALILLTWTRWGQARPLAKCIALSVLAHLLFAGFAYSTRMVLDVPRQDGGELRVTLVERGEPTPPRETAPRPWDELASHEPPVPPLVETERPLPPPPDPTTPWDEPPPAPPLLADATPAPSMDESPPPLPEMLSQADAFVAPAAIDDSQTMADEPATAAPSEVPDPLEMAASAARIDTRPTESLSDATSPPAAAELRDVVDEALAAARAAAADSTNDTAINDAATAAPTAGRASNDALPDVANDPLAQRPVPRRLADGQPLPEPYRARVAESRLALALAKGGDERTEQAVAEALGWLAAHQAPDGRWEGRRFGAGQESKVLGHDRGGAGTDADTAFTGLAVLAFLGSGQTHYEGERREHVQHGLEFLLRSQAADGSLAGGSTLFARMYCHGIATLAISEAYAMSGDQRLRPFVERAIGYSVAAQDPISGGWRYQPRDRGGDMSQFGWQVMAFRSAELAGLPLAPSTRIQMQRFLESCAAGNHRGLACYRPGEQPSRAMTAESLTCRFFLGMRPTTSLRQEAADFLLSELPGQSRIDDLYGWYYGTLALYQDQGPAWPRWNEALKGRLLTLQRHDGEHAGSWEPSTRWGGYGGRVYSTAMATLCLEVYYRYLPVYGE